MVDDGQLVYLRTHEKVCQFKDSHFTGFVVLFQNVVYNFERRKIISEDLDSHCGKTEERLFLEHVAVYVGG